MRPLNWLVIATTVVIALAPILVDQAKKEADRWRLAAAINAVELDGADVQESFASFNDPHFNRMILLYRMLRELKYPTRDSYPEFVRTTLADSPDLRSIKNSLIAELSEEQRFEDAIEVQLILAVESDYEESEFLNGLAYHRSLALRDLDEALVDIDKALRLADGDLPRMSMYLDTRAWVLYQMGKPLEALKDIDKSLALFTEVLKQDWLGYALKQASEIGTNGNKSAQEESDEDSIYEEPLPKRQIQAATWHEGVLRYHRAKILESIGRTEDANVDFHWLRQNRLPLDGTLY